MCILSNVAIARATLIGATTLLACACSTPQSTVRDHPSPEVRILGLTAEEEQGLGTLEPSRGVLGSWLDDRWPLGDRITIYRQGGKLYLEHKFGDSSSVIREMVEKPSSRGRRFEKIGGSNFGEYFLMGRDGNLDIWDQEGHITTARRIIG